MNDSDDEAARPDRDGASTGVDPADDRRNREAAALRENLRKRKDQARLRQKRREAAGSETSNDTESAEEG